MSREGSRREPAPVKHPLAFSRARALQEHLLFVSWCHPWLSSPGPSLGPPAHPALSPWLFSTHQDALSQLQDSVHGFGGHRATVDMEQSCHPKCWVFKQSSSCVKHEILHWELQGFPTLGWSPRCRVERFRGDKIIFLAVWNSLILVPRLVWVFSRAAIKNHEYGFNISNWEHLPSPINTLPCQPWPEG